VNNTQGEKMSFLDISLIVPCFNEENSILAFYQETTQILAALAGTARISAHEFIFVDDGSTDKTLTILRSLSAQDMRVHYISFSRNFGKEAALLAGLRKACGRYAVVLDVDGQDPPALIPEMLEAVRSGEFDCAGTRRVNRKGEPPIRSFFARCFYRIMVKISDIEILDGVRDFRLFNRNYLDAILALPERNRFSKGIFPWVGFKTKWFEYDNIERNTGVTKWSLLKLFLYSIDGIIAFSTKPLSIAAVLGVLFCLIAIASILYIIVSKTLWDYRIIGWASTVCIILLCSGVQLFTTGILGQYLAKTYMEVKQRPHYVIREEK
jgi:glycosyltransferase involved in cell wall biosynthesis